MRNIFRRKPAADPAAKRYPDALARLLAAFLDRPSADDSAAEEEDVTTFVIGDLAYPGDLSAYPAIKRAYEENRVNPQVIGLENVEAHYYLHLQPR